MIKEQAYLNNFTAQIRVIENALKEIKVNKKVNNIIKNYGLSKNKRSKNRS